MVVYIAGKMNGLPDKGRKAFEDAETELKAMGFTVLNPACLPDGLPGDRYMPTCLTMVDTVDILVLLPGWENSPGAMLEKAYAEYQQKMVFTLDGFAECMNEWNKLLASTWERTHGDHPCQTLPGFIRYHCNMVIKPLLGSEEPVRHGRWRVVNVPKKWGGATLRCSECNTGTGKTWNYCPDCGAKMDLKED